ncbi:hypothetical protein [Streptomyces sp. SID12501]|uniref:Uncharacterized protein n=1 Tax=Streptomyces sp. SID12501 TaxID=2706042 RepID=A0A6B3BL36_9ACTN|nr:hypothetical protein [Streptomyces sp. SID12501]NEC84709.1 hypothetical protein [Streptomyces sp. SID12501]
MNNHRATASHQSVPPAADKPSRGDAKSAAPTRALAFAALTLGAATALLAHHLADHTAHRARLLARTIATLSRPA